MKRTKEEVEQTRAEHKAKNLPRVRRVQGRPRNLEDKERLTIYLPELIAEQLKASAKRDARSISGQVEILVKRHAGEK